MTLKSLTSTVPIQLTVRSNSWLIFTDSSIFSLQLAIMYVWDQFKRCLVQNVQAIAKVQTVKCLGFALTVSEISSHVVNNCHTNAMTIEKLSYIRNWRGMPKAIFYTKLAHINWEVPILTARGKIFFGLKLNIKFYFKPSMEAYRN